jgi:hypothetical protein
MVDPKVVKQQLDRIGEQISIFGEAEAKELPHILMEGEELQHVVVGRYSGGFAIMCATNLRLLLIDKKLLFLTVEDIRYDMIAELDYGHQLLAATVHVRSFSKDLKFTSWRKEKLRAFTTYLQHRVMEIRQQQSAHNPATQGPAIPLQTFDEPSGSLTLEQVQSLLPVNAERWYKANPPVQMMNPYVQSPLMTRRRVGRFSPAGK